MLYLAKRATPDCLTAETFLATRVTKCSVNDLSKLEILMRYVWSTRERGVIFAPGKKGVTVSVLIDAAHGVHPDGKLHTGSCIVVGSRGTVHCKSAKQQIVNKSSTEAELVALSDSANPALYLRNFIMAQGYLCGPVVVYQDNKLCMSLIERGRSAAVLLAQGASRYRGGASKTSGDKGDICESSNEAAAGITIQARKKWDHQMAGRQSI